MEKANVSIYCNLCQQNFNHEDFLNHVPNEHLPELDLTCSYCESQQVSFVELQLHLVTAHKSDNVARNVLQFSDLFTSSNDISLHSKKCAEWIQQSFTSDFKNILNNAEIRSIIKRSYTHIYDEYENDCELCENEENHVRCGYCNQQFLRKCHLKFHVLRKHILLPDHILKSINVCEACRKIYPTKKILMQHNCTCKDLSTKMKMKLQICSLCSKTFANRSNLSRHIMNQHRETVGTIPNQNVFTCDLCKCVFLNKISVKRHIENLHLEKGLIRKNISCFQCEQKFNSIKNLNAHLTLTHEIKIDEETLQFSHLDDFYSWKQEEELRTNSRFIQLRGLRKQCKKGEEISSLKFICNRSGIFHSKSNGKRAYRVKGSSKIGRYCSAYIQILFKGNQSVTGVYCSTHCGHDNDLRYLTLTMDEKREIYEKIKSGAPFSSILNEIRNNVGKEIKRKHLVTNKDLHNIVTTFKKISNPSRDDISAQSLSSSSTNPLESTNDPSSENHQHFDSELDLCADLWVETCQRMVNRFDQNERHSEHVCKDPKSRNTGLVMTTTQQDFRNNADFYRTTCVGYHDHGSDNLSDVPQQSYKPTTYHRYENQATKKHNLSVISHKLRFDKDFYPNNIVDVNSHTPANKNIPKSSVNCANTIDDSQAYSRNTNAYDKLLSNTNLADYSNRLPTTSNSEYEHLVYSSDEEDFADTDVIRNDIAVSEDESETPAENKDNNEVSDLRDRVNSVTALYNIVESELDDRKKKIIRNYVDNMFRVLQHRYNKCRTKKKQGSQKQQINKDGKSKNRLPSIEQKRKKNKTLSSKPAQYNISSEFISKVPDTSHMTQFHSYAIDNTAERPDTEFMRWDRY